MFIIILESLFCFKLNWQSINKSYYLTIIITSHFAHRKTCTAETPAWFIVKIHPKIQLMFHHRVSHSNHPDCQNLHFEKGLHLIQEIQLLVQVCMSLLDSWLPHFSSFYLKSSASIYRLSYNVPPVHCSDDIIKGDNSSHIFSPLRDFDIKTKKKV